MGASTVVLVGAIPLAKDIEFVILDKTDSVSYRSPSPR
jgi:hypothetical protein